LEWFNKNGVGTFAGFGDVKDALHVHWGFHWQAERLFDARSSRGRGAVQPQQGTEASD
jgi:hypothetical protein